MATKKKPADAARKPVRPKRAAKKPAKPRDLNKAEAFYVESHFGTKPPQAIAADIDAPVASVEAYIEQLREAGFEPKKQKTPIQKAGFAVSGGSVSMTKTASERGDDFRGVTADGAKAKKGRNEKFFQKRQAGLHIINPDLPTY